MELIIKTGPSRLEKTNLKSSMRICRVATVPFFLQNHLRDQIIATAAAGHRITLIAGNGPEISELIKLKGIEFVQIDIPRNISPLRDLRALWTLYRHLMLNRYDILHSTTPKAGMLSAIAGFCAQIPIRLHTFTGQPWIERHGFLRAVAKTGDRITAALNTICYADSHSQREFLVAEKICKKNAIAVIGFGSLAGVNLNKFDFSRRKDLGSALRKELGIPNTAVIITFIGRLTPDKGVSELISAFLEIFRSHKNCFLILVGPIETEHSPLSDNTVSSIESHQNIKAVGYSDEPEKFLAATDIFCLPSYREGFGNVVIEAAAMGVPTVGTDIVGLCDAVVDGDTGMLVQPKDVGALVSVLTKLIVNVDLRLSLGRKARERAIANFDSVKINTEVLTEYDRIAKIQRIKS